MYEKLGRAAGKEDICTPSPVLKVPFVILFYLKRILALADVAQQIELWPTKQKKAAN